MRAVRLAGTTLKGCYRPAEITARNAPKPMIRKGKRMSETSASGTPGGAIPGLSAAESEKLQAAFQDIAARSQKLLEEFAERYKQEGPQPVDPLRLTQTFMDFTAKMLADPNKLVQ